MTTRKSKVDIHDYFDPPRHPFSRGAMKCLLVVVVAIALGASACWSDGDSADAGIASDLGEQIDAGIDQGRFDNLHAVLVVHESELILERYYEGQDEIWGRTRGRVAFGPDELHDLRSVTKSLVSLLYGIALSEGIVPPLDAPLVEQFPEYPDLATDAQRGRMTVAHALTMTMGTEWDENLPYTDPRNSETAMELAEDRYRFVLDRPMVTEPGIQWTYNSGATAVIGRLIAKGSGRSLLDYAEEKLFAPLDIAEFEWVRGKDGEHIASSGLRLRPLDLAKIGEMLLDDGRWNGRQVVPADWLEQSFTSPASPDDTNYGYQWWLSPGGSDQAADDPRWVAGLGNGGQILYLAPDLDLLVVINAGNYNDQEASGRLRAIVFEIVLPAVQP
ncbi:MAG: serine hydrolase domain-containing protein [Acidimicrobiales bacterium]